MIILQAGSGTADQRKPFQQRLRSAASCHSGMRGRGLGNCPIKGAIGAGGWGYVPHRRGRLNCVLRLPGLVLPAIDGSW